MVWVIQFRVDHENKTVWKTAEEFDNEMDAINRCREKNLEENKIGWYRVHRMEP